MNKHDTLKALHDPIEFLFEPDSFSNSDSIKGLFAWKALERRGPLAFCFSSLEATIRLNSVSIFRPFTVRSCQGCRRHLSENGMISPASLRSDIACDSWPSCMQKSLNHYLLHCVSQVTSLHIRIAWKITALTLCIKRQWFVCRLCASTDPQANLFHFFRFQNHT